MSTPEAIFCGSTDTLKCVLNDILDSGSSPYEVIEVLVEVTGITVYFDYAPTDLLEYVHVMTIRECLDGLDIIKAESESFICN